MRSKTNTRCILLLLGLLSSCAAEAESDEPRAAPPMDTPYLVVLGSAQDAGLPQIACRKDCCEAARSDPSRRRYASSLLLADPRSGARWLFDASPDLREQVDRAQGHPESRVDPTARPPLFDGIFVTHAHMGHYAGLLHLGREAYGARAQVLHASPRFCGFMESNAPWKLMLELGNLVARPIEPGGTLKLAPDISVKALAVPHRDEFSDTLAFVIKGPERSALYLPDIDKWERFSTPIEELIAEVDIAFLDGTFFADGEIPGRAMSEIPHPFIEESLRRFADLPASERAKIRFIHLNHSNPAADPSSEAARRVREAGSAVVEEGERHAL